MFFLPVLLKLFFDKIATTFSLHNEPHLGSNILTGCVILLICLLIRLLQAIQNFVGKYFRFHRIYILSKFNFICSPTLPLCVPSLVKNRIKIITFTRFLKYLRKVFLLLWDPYGSNFNWIYSVTIPICTPSCGNVIENLTLPNLVTMG